MTLKSDRTETIMEEQRRNSEGQQATADRHHLLRTLVRLLLVILMLQSFAILLYFQRSSTKSAGQPSFLEHVQRNQADAGPLPLSQSEEVVELVNKLQSAFEKQEPVRGIQFAIHNIRVVAATDISEIVVAAQFSSDSPQPIQSVLGQITLLNSAGALIYQDRGEALLDGRTDGEIRFIVDNPPEFERANVELTELRFQTTQFNRSE